MSEKSYSKQVYHESSTKKKKFEILSRDLSSKDYFINIFLKVGVRSVPLIKKNLYIHVITKDFHSIKLKNKKQYNSFNTRLLIKYYQLPLDVLPDKEKREGDVKKSLIWYVVILREIMVINSVS